MPQPPPAPAWASTSVGRLIAGTERTGTVFADGPAASYVAVPDGDGPELLLALLAPGAVRLPIGMCLTRGPMPRRGGAVRIGNGRVAADDRTWRPTRWWDPRPHLDTGALLDGAEALIDVVAAEPAAAFGLPLMDALTVAAALIRGPDAASGVIGLGPGLTPSGDDVVAGALAVLAILGRLETSTRDAIERLARTRTTTLSAALVAAAGRGEMIPQAARLLAAVSADAAPEPLSSAARALFAVGSTSGHDLAAGMAGALRSAA